MQESHLLKTRKTLKIQYIVGEKSFLLVSIRPLFEQKNCVRIVYTGQREGTGEGEIRMNDKFFDLKSEKQDRMINASLHLFAVNGYKHASTDDIIKEAGISKGLLFHYFTSKQGLYDFLLDYSVRYLLFEYDRAIGSEKEYFAFYGKLEAAKNNGGSVGPAYDGMELVC